MKKLTYIFMILGILLGNSAYADLHDDIWRDGKEYGDADLIEIDDDGLYYTGDNVEDALQEIGDGTTLDPVYHRLDSANTPFTSSVQVQTAGGAGGFLKLADDSSYLLLADGVSKLILEGGDSIITIAGSSITSSAGSIDFDNEDLTTTGIITAGTITDGTGTLTGGVLSGISQIGATGDTDLIQLASGSVTVNGDIFTDQYLGSNTNTFLGINVAGRGLLEHNTGVEGWNNTSIGYTSLFALTTGSDNVAMGFYAGQTMTTGARNLALGTYSQAFTLSGHDNVSIGYSALGTNSTGSNNVAIGTNSLQNSLLHYNVGIGYGTLSSVSGAGGSNIGIGYQAGDNITTGSENIMIGHQVDADSATGSNQLNIGDAITGNLTTGDITIANDLDVTGEIIARTNLTVGTATPAAGFSGTGDIYGTGSTKAMEGLFSESAPYGAGLEISDNALATTYLSLTGVATLTASTQTIYDSGATFTTDYVGQFLKVFGSDAPSFAGATGQIVKYTDATHIVVSFGSTGGDAISDATGMTFVVYPAPNFYVSDNGDIHAKVGASNDASFKIESPYGNNDHAVHVVAKAGINSHCGLDMEIDADTYAGVSGYCLDYDATGYIAGISGTGLNMVIDNNGATGGDLHGIDVAVTDTSNTDMETVAVGTNEGVEVIHQHLGTASAIASAFTYDLSTTTYTDVTTAFGTDGTNVQMFTGDNDKIYIASLTKFDQTNVILAVNASTTIAPTFEYSVDDGTWVAFTPSDDTNGLQQSGTMRFDSDNLTTWGLRTVNEVTGEAGAVDYYWIRITRTRNNVPTPPTESTIKVTTTGTFHTWDKEGRLGIKTFSQSAEPTTTDLPANLFCFWIDTDDSKLYICYNAGGTVKTVEMT